MDHNDVRHKLSEYIDGAVTTDERSAIEQHLATCTTCSDALREIRKTIEHLHSVPEVEPPAWMTSKIMAKVREEKEQKKSIVRRLFFPLAVKVPLQAVAILFLVVTAFYIYRDLNPAARYSEAPQEALAKREAPGAAGKVLTQKAPEPPAMQETEVPQSSGYKALDMKNEYERPAAPVPAAPQAAPSEKPGSAQRNMASRPAPPTPMAEQAAGAVRNLERKQATGAAGQLAGTEPSASDYLRSQVQKADKVESVDDAEAMMDVTAHFTQHDLRPDMMVRGLQYATRRLPNDLAGVGWLSEMRSYRRSSCRNRYIVDVELAGNSSKYLYCYHRGRIRLIGVYDLVSGVWMERQ